MSLSVVRLSRLAGLCGPSLWSCAWALGLALTGACYSALDPAGDSSSQYADEPNSTQGTAFVPMPAQAWIGMNIMPTNANTMCVDGVVASGTHVSLQACSGAVLQRFKWVEGVLSVAGNRCLGLDAANGAAKVGTAVQLQPCDANNTSQLWAYNNGFVVPEVAGRTTPASLCLSTVGADVAAASTLQLVACTQTPAPMTWDMSLYDGNSWVGFPISASLNAATCIDDYGNATANGSRVAMYACHGSESQGFTMHAGALMLNATCLNISGDAASTTASGGTLIEMYQCLPNAENQLWAIEHGRIHAYSGPNVDRCMEVPGGNVGQNTQLDVLSCSAESTLTAAPQMHWVLGFDQRTGS